jgi:hypothetical protein
MNINSLTLHWLTQIRKTLAEIYKVPERQVFLTTKPLEQFRLLNWRVWCLRYSIPLAFLIRTLLKAFSYLSRSLRKGHYGLGIPVGTLTGELAQKRLEEAIVKTFPDGENLAMRRSHLQIKMLEYGPTVKLVNDSTRNEMISSYLEKIRSRRRMRSTAKHQYRRPWRGNPWR